MALDEQHLRTGAVGAVGMWDYAAGEFTTPALAVGEKVIATVDHRAVSATVTRAATFGAPLQPSCVCADTGIVMRVLGNAAVVDEAALDQGEGFCVEIERTELPYGASAAATVIWSRRGIAL